MRFDMDSKATMQMQQQQPQQQQQHILSAAEGGLPALTSHGRFLNAKTDSSGIVGGMLDRDCRVALEERELWSKFQELTNEMIVTKNGRYCSTPIPIYN